MEQSTSDISWSIPQRQSPAAILILFLQTGFTMLKAFWPVLIIYFLRRQEDKEGMQIIWMAAGFTLLTIITTLIRFWFYKFHISNEHLVIQSGWLKKKTLSIPLRNILGVHLEQNVWQQILKVSRVTIDSSGSEKAEVKIDALSLVKAEELKQLLLSNESIRDNVTEQIAPDHAIRLSFTDLMKLSLSANHLEAFFILFALGINIIQDINRIFNIDSWALIDNYAGNIQDQKMMAAGFIIIMISLLSVVVSVIRTVIKYYRFTLDDTVRGWKISFGLITRRQNIVPYNKIQFLSWRSNWLRRKIDMWIVHVHSIGHEDVKNNLRVSLPVTSLQKTFNLAKRYQQTPVFQKSSGKMIHDSYWRRRSILVGLPVCLVLCIIFYFVSGINGLWIALLLPVIAAHYYKWYYNFRWTSNEEGLQVYSGAWGRKYQLLTWKKIQQVQMSQGIYQRTKNLANIRFVTAGGSIVIPYVDHAIAIHLMDKALYYVESRNDNWM